MILALVPLAFAATFAAEIERAGAERIAPWLAAQIRHESGWDPLAVSPAGARGLTQVMPATWDWAAGRVQPSCADADPFDAACSIRVQIAVMRWSANVQAIAHEVTAPTALGLVNLALAGYNAGPGHILSQRRSCRQVRDCHSGRWLWHVERGEHCTR